MQLKLLEAFELPELYKILLEDDIAYKLCANPTLITENNLGEFLLQTDRNTDSVAYCIYDGNGIISGVVTLNNINYLKSSAFLGVIAVAPNTSGTLGLKAARWAIDHCFNTLNLNRVYGHSWADNVQMDALYKLMGATHEGTEREHMYKQGKFVDMKVWSILKREWKWHTD